MDFNSSVVNTNQSGVHSDVSYIVKKNKNNSYKRPISKHNINAYEQAMSKTTSKKIIFDSGCGKGKSTQKLAYQYPDCFIIGIDKSELRLKKSFANKDQIIKNFCIVRADLVDFWRLATEDGLKLENHFIFYPNPWPKKNHLKRRWHCSPVFKNIIQLGGRLEIRTNWKIYLDEFSLALSEYRLRSENRLYLPKNNNYLSDFEEKYHKSGHDLWKLTTDINNMV